MILTHYELGRICDGLSILQANMMKDYHAYREQNNQPAADDCLTEYKFLRDLTMRLEENKHGYDEVAAYELK